MADIIRAGIIGCDTSHVISFTRLFHEEDHAQHVPGVRVVAAYPSFSPDIRSSVERVDGFREQLAERYGVRIVDSIAEVVRDVDAILIESVDGRRHLRELQAVAHAGKPVYIDKPFAASLEDARKMVELIEARDLPCFSCSSLRFDSAIREAADDGEACGGVMGCDAFSPAHLEPTNPGFFWYGIHGVEILYTILGAGCRTVRCTSTDDGDVAVGVWKDGRLGTMRGIRKGRQGFGATVLCANRPPKLVTSVGDYYPRLLEAMVAFFRTGRPPFPIRETLELCAFIDAAWRSSKRDGADIRLDL